MTALPRPTPAPFSREQWMLMQVSVWQSLGYLVIVDMRGREVLGFVAYPPPHLTDGCIIAVVTEDC